MLFRIADYLNDCDSRSCIVFKGPQFEENNKIVKVNDKCYKVIEKY